ncbi:MAG: metallophosphatase [Bacteroidales bacterium]|nr:metallophosphatase [Bacteroidales bacterium]
MKTKLYFIVAAAVLISAAAAAQKTERLVILHTNDTHSQIEPTDASASRNPDMGGYARRLGVINEIRKKEPHVLLVDAGDFSQGTPYYNFFGGRLEVKGYNQMQYDATALGNHEFDNGMDSLATILALKNFPVVVSNYDVSASKIRELVEPWLVVKKGKLKIGIMGLGVEPAGLIMEKNYEGVVYNDPVTTAREVSDFLRNEKKCDLVICLSHLGSDSTDVKVNDFTIARATTNIDVIIGGHSHSLLENVTTPNAAGRRVMIAQMGRSGLYLGRIDLEFTQK